MSKRPNSSRIRLRFTYWFGVGLVQALPRMRQTRARICCRLCQLKIPTKLPRRSSHPSSYSFPPFHSSYDGASSFRHVTDQAGDGSTSHPNMNQQVRGKNHKDHRRCGNVFATIEDVCMRHKRTRPLGKAPGVGQSITAMLKTSREFRPTGTLNSVRPLGDPFRVERVASSHPGFRESILA